MRPSACMNFECCHGTGTLATVDQSPGAVVTRLRPLLLAVHEALSQGVTVSAAIHAISEIPDDDSGAPLDELPDGGPPVVVAHVHDHLVPAVQQRLRGQAAEPVRRTGDEDPRHAASAPLRSAQARSAGTPVEVSASLSASVTAQLARRASFSCVEDPGSAV
jgi:hypothetical protein